MLMAVMGTLFILSCIMVSLHEQFSRYGLMGAQIGIAYLFGARFDMAFNDLMGGKISQVAQKATQSVTQKYDHKEL